MTAALLLLLFVSSAFGRIHRLRLEDDTRRAATLSSFGFLAGGTLTVNLTLFKMKASSRAASGTMPKFEFTLDKSKSVSLPSEYDDMEHACILNNPDSKYPIPNYIRFSFDLEQNRVLIQPVGSDVQRLLVSDQPRQYFLKAHSDSQSNDSGVGFPEVPEKSVTLSSVDLSGTKDGGFQTYFWVSIQRPEEEGQYFLRFHNCPGNHDSSGARVTLKMEITEDNNGNFLTAGEMPVPALYFTFSVLFFIAGVAWLSVLRRSQEDVYKIHYLMLVVVFVKSLACLFHGMNMHFMQISGILQDVWAALWYFISFMEGVLLVMTLLLMAVGWACQKSQLARREKVVLCFALFFKVLHQVEEIIIQESEEGEASRFTWQEMAILTNLLCWASVLIPAVWTLRSLKNALGVQVKAVVRPYTSKLFGYFYCLVVIYIYITQIVAYLLKMALTFRQLWVSVLCSELATLLFFLLSGVLFRPTRGHFYTPVSQDCDSAYTPAFQDGDNTCIEMPENGDSACGLEPPDHSAYKDTETEVDKMMAERDKTGSNVHADQQPEGSTGQNMQQKN